MILNVITLVNRTMSKFKIYFLIISFFVGLTGIFLLLNYLLTLPYIVGVDVGFDFALFNTPFFVIGVYCIISSVLLYVRFSINQVTNINIVFLILNFGLLPALPRILFDPNEMNELYIDAVIMITAFAVYLINKKVINKHFK